VKIGGDTLLLYGEAVDLGDGEPSAAETSTTSVTTPTGEVAVAITTRTIARAELEAFLRDLQTGNARCDGRAIRTGRLVRRERTIVPVRHGLGDDEGASLHPDGRYTYVLEELWDADEQTFQRLWDTRGFVAIAKAVQSYIGVALHNVSDRIGNFLVFERLSPWRIDSQCDVGAPARWVRAVSTCGNQATLRLHVRVLDGYETVTEQVLDLPPQGVPIAGADYTQVSYSLFDANGRFLARSAGALIGDAHVSVGVALSADVVDSSGASLNVMWPPWPGGVPLRGIRANQPWVSRASHRALRNLKQREATNAFTFGHKSEAEVAGLLREILRERIRDFVYVWDPYLDSKAVIDILQWIHPQVPCRILCGNSANAGQKAALRQALQTLRATPMVRAVECKHRVERRGTEYRALYHDRFIITRDAAWMLGASLNHIGRAPGSVMRVHDPDPLRWMFEDEWNAPLASAIVETPL